MSKKTVKESDSIWYLSSKPTLGDPNEGRFPAWFEAHITSDRANNALEENSSLGFAEEAAWTPEDLQDSGAIDDLLQSAANTVKRMDGVGFWVNNLQDNMRFGQPPHTMADAQEQANAYGPAQRYW